MTDSYRQKEKAKLLLNASQIKGLPSDITLSFGTAYIKFYKNEPNYFSCTLFFSKKKDDQGYPLELDFMSFIGSDEDDLDDDMDDMDDFYDDVYDAPLQDHTYESLAEACSCHFEEVIERGKRFIKLVLKVSGTSFYGWVMIDSELYRFI